MNHFFSNTTQKVSANPCTGRAPVHQGKKKKKKKKKHGRANPNLKQGRSLFSTSKGLFRLIGCLKVRRLTRSTTRRFRQTFLNGWGDLKCGWTAHGFFNKTTRRHTTPCQDIFCEAQDHRVGTSTVLTWPSHMWLFPKVVCVKRKFALSSNGERLCVQASYTAIAVFVSWTHRLRQNTLTEAATTVHTMSEHQDIQAYCFDLTSPRLTTFEIHEWIHSCCCQGLKRAQHKVLCVCFNLSVAVMFIYSLTYLTQSL